jgi:hypothetical protein
MSDAGGSTPITDARLVFSDFATQSLPDLTGITSGRYKPTNHGTGDALPSPAPQPPYGSTLSVFNGTDANGTWSLYVSDDEAPDSGVMSGGWVLDIITTTPRISAVPDQETPQNTPLTVPFLVDDADTPIGQLVVEAVTDNPAVISRLTLAGTGNERTVSIFPVQDAFGVAGVTLSVSDGTGFALSSFNVAVTRVNQPPTITGLPTAITTQASTPATVPFIVGDDMTPPEELVVAAYILNADFGTVAVTGEGRQREFNFEPAGLVGQTQAGVTVNDGEVTTTQVIALTIEPQLGPVIAPIEDQTTPEDTRLDVPILIANSTSPQLEVLAFAANQQVIESINVSGTGIARILSITPRRNASGESDILIFARDEFGTDNATFKVTVLPVDDPPELGAIANQTTTRNVPVEILLDVSDPDTPISELVFSGLSSDPNLVSGLEFDNDGTRVIAKVNLVTDATGVAACTIFCSDGSSQVSRLFLLTVTAGEPPMLSYSLVGDLFTIRIAGDPGVTYEIQATTDFKTWSAITEVTADSLGNAEYSLLATGPGQYFQAVDK